KVVLVETSPSQASRFTRDFANVKLWTYWSWLSTHMRRASPGRTTKLGRTPWRAWLGLTRPGTRYTRFGSASDWMFLVISLSTRGLAGARGAGPARAAAGGGRGAAA